jgi:hypothetical protein
MIEGRQSRRPVDLVQFNGAKIEVLRGFREYEKR